MITRSKSKPMPKPNDEKIGCQKEEIVDIHHSAAVEEATVKLNEKLVHSFKTIIQRQEITISTLKTSLQTKNEKIENLEKKNKELNNYLAEVLLLTLRTRSEIFPDGSKMIQYSEMDCDA